MHVPFQEYRNLLLRYLYPQKIKVALLAFFLCSATALQLFNPQLLRAFIDTVSGNSAQTSLAVIASLFIIVAIAQQIVSVCATYFGERVGWSATNALRADLALHLLRLDLSFHKVHTPGELIERVDGDVTAMANFFSQFVVKIIGSVLLLVGIITVLWFEDWRVGLALTIFAILLIASIGSVRNIAVKHWKRFRQISAELFGFLEERLVGTEDIRASGAQAYVMRRLMMYTRDRFLTARKARVISMIPWGFPILFFAVGNILAFTLAAILYAGGAMSIGTAFLVYYYTQLLGQPIMMLLEQLDDLQKASAGMIRVAELFQMSSKLADGHGAPLPDGALSIEFNGVDFGYGEEEMILKDVSFTLQAGEVLGLLGRTGSGKTTITRLLLRLYDPARGSIRLGGTEIRDASIAELREHIGIVTQDVQLFHASIRDNLTFFDSRIEDQKIIQALEELGLTHWYTQLPAGLDTMLAPNGGGLSAGEAQLLAFTRVFLRNPGLIILDEASSRLDPATERLIEEAINKLLHGRTGIIIAHRLGTIQRADTIIIMEAGRIGEYGARSQLLASPDTRFAQLLQTAHEEVLA